MLLCPYCADSQAYIPGQHNSLDTKLIESVSMAFVFVDFFSSLSFRLIQIRDEP